ncbi:TIGR02452 family protein [Blastopirellula retiformator]|uniref:Microbial-type PARG catalytic domain-containing protein n=1 Tax=Blastopirellula retiformator TaxID=2527970 RepID=A0A5C5V0Q6_9BACT|nr:TIGR02452 family protein [Blastopirellula retiformator]TWT31367.1 hypothetical protein Enr8_32880 [Blastopirellula retiformator]
MTSRSTRRSIAGETVEILDRGTYVSNGEQVSIEPQLTESLAGTRLYTPEQAESLAAKLAAPDSPHNTQLRVDNCTTFAAVRRQIAEGFRDPVCLNFASAKNQGGGFLGGSQAQEESLARASGLYASLQKAPTYYEVNRAGGSCLYTHHLIYSPRAPVFRDDDDQLLPQPYATSIITSPAVNAGAVRQNEPQNVTQIEPVMRERLAHVLAVALAHGHDAIVLGAWGCGVFRNDPGEVARWMHEALTQDPRFVGAFAKVDFAVLDFTSEKKTYEAFRQQFA